MWVSLLALAIASEDGPPPVILQEEPEDRAPFAALAHPVGGWGVGLILGLPTGVSGAYRPPTGRLWADGAVAWAVDRDTLDVHVDALFTLAEPTSEDIPDVRFPVWVGLGPRLRLGDTPETPGSGALTLAVRVPFGMSFIHEEAPVEGFLELVPGVGIHPTFFPMFDVAVGARYYFVTSRPE